MRIVTSWDDASVQDLEIAKLLKKYGLEKNSTFYFPVMPSVVNEPKGRASLSLEQMDSIAKDFEIGSHTITHPLLTRIPPSVAVPEIKDSRKMLQKRFNQPIKKFCYPRGYANPKLQELVVNAGYTSARSTVVGYIHESENPFFEQTTVHVGSNRKEYAGYDWFQYASIMLTQARIEDGVYHLWGHSWEITAYPNGLKLLDELLKEVVW